MFFSELLHDASATETESKITNGVFIKSLPLSFTFFWLQQTDHRQWSHLRITSLLTKKSLVLLLRGVVRECYPLPLQRDRHTLQRDLLIAETLIAMQIQEMKLAQSTS